jgi:hypothetical protein
MCAGSVSLREAPLRLEGGLPLSRTSDPTPVAAALAGVPANTIEEWVRRGEGRDERPATPFYRQLAEDIRMARAKAHARAMSSINLHMLADPKAAMWFLENEDPHWRQRHMPPPPAPPPAIASGPRIGQQTNVVVITRADLEAMGNQRLLSQLTGPEPDEDARSGLVTIERG